MKKSFKLLLLCATLWSAPLFSQPILRLPAVIGSNMVLEQNTEVNLWGWADPKATVMIVADWNSADTVKVKAGGDTRWTAKLKTPAASGAHSIKFISKDQELTINNVLLGEVWLCSGQSNMNWSAARGIKDMAQELQGKMNDSIRIFTVPLSSNVYPQADCDGQWMVCSAENAKWFSAVGYFFGKHLYDGLKVPVGLINSSWGGTPVEAWTPGKVTATDKEILDSWKTLKKWHGSPISYGTIYNGMIEPIKRMTIAGTIWYQGEDNVGNYKTYAKSMVSMIREWRKIYGETMPFYMVQIAPFTYKQFTDREPAMLREQQQIATESLSGVGIIAIPDLVDNVKDIHPVYKDQVGKRLANWALTEKYGKDVGKYRQAKFESVKINGRKAEVSFRDAEGGLTCPDKQVTTLELAGADMQFYPAVGTIDKKRGILVVTSDKVDKPIAVRYSFSNDAIGNLFDAAGLPVMPFRSDK